MDIETYKKIIEKGTSCSELSQQRLRVAEIASVTFHDVGKKLFAMGHFVGGDRVSNASPFGHGNDEIVGMATLLQMGGHLVAASSNLLVSGNPYAGAALLRHLVEIEYVVWAFNVRDGDAERWIRSDKESRHKFFSPKKLRNASNGQFRGIDYGYHCELGGHPTPSGRLLLKNQNSTNQLLLSDLLGHVLGIWENFVCWAERNEETMILFSGVTPVLPEELEQWRSNDPLVDLPPPP